MRAAGRFAARARWIDGLALALLLVCTVVLNWPALASKDSLPGSGPESDLWVTSWGNAAYLKQAVALTHSIPLWNPHTMSGRPFAGDPLAAIFYPPMELVHLLTLRDFFLLVMMAHMVLAGFGAYALARRGVGLGPGAALLTAVAFMWSPRFVGHYGAGHLTMIMAAAWLPWVALGLVLAIRENAIWTAPAGFAFGLAILAGHPQVAFYHVLMIGGLTLGGIVWAAARERTRRDRLLAALRVVGIAAATGVIGALIGAALIVPALQFTGVSLRQSGLGIQDRLPFTWVFQYLTMVPTPTSPHGGPSQELTFAPGIGVLLLAPLSFFRRRWLALGLFAAVLACLIIAVGARTPVLPLLAARLPGFGYFRAPARVWFLAEVALTIMAGLGFEVLLSGRPALRVLQVAMIALLAANLWQLDQPLLNINPSGPGHEPLAIEQAAVKFAGGQQVYGVQRNVRQAITSQLGLDLADGQDPLQIASYADFMRLAGGYKFDGYALAIPPFEVYDKGWPTSQQAQPDAYLLGLLNVGVVLSRHQLYDTDLVQVDRVDGTFVYRNRAVLPRAFLVSADLGRTISGLDVAHFATLGISGAVVPDARAGTSSVAVNPSGELAVTVNASENAFLVVGNPWYPGWQAKVDGHPATLVKVGGVIEGVAVPAGNHMVEIVYRPIAVWLGLTLCLLGLLVTAGWTAWFAHRSRRGRALLS